MKILYVITGADIGGAQKHVLYLADWFSRNGHDVRVVVGEDGPFIKELNDRHVEVTVIPIPRTIHIVQDLKALWKLVRYLHREKFDVVHSHSSIAGILTRIAGFLNRVEHNIFTAHGFVFTDPTLSKKKKWVYLLLEKMCSWISTQIITVSAFDYQKGLEAGINQHKMHVIPNGIPNETIISLPDWQQKQVRLAQQDKRIIGFVGRFASEKNLDMLIRVAAHFKKHQQENIEFWLLGDGPLFDHYQAEISRQELTSFIQLKGEQEHVSDWMDRMHVLVITSHKEGLPYVLLEACGRGLPVISTDVGGIKEVVDPQNNKNILVKINDDEAMYQRLLSLLSDDPYREEQGKYFLNLSGIYSVELMCKQTTELYFASHKGNRQHVITYK